MMGTEYGIHRLLLGAFAITMHAPHPTAYARLSLSTVKQAAHPPPTVPARRPGLPYHEMAGASCCACALPKQQSVGSRGRPSLRAQQRAG